MTHEEEFESFVGGSEDDPGELCRRCHDYPCCCTADEITMHRDWEADIYARCELEDRMEESQ